MSLQVSRLSSVIAFAALLGSGCGSTDAAGGDDVAKDAGSTVSSSDSAGAGAGAGVGPGGAGRGGNTSPASTSTGGASGNTSSDSAGLGATAAGGGGATDSAGSGGSEATRFDCSHRAVFQPSSADEELSVGTFCDEIYVCLMDSETVAAAQAAVPELACGAEENFFSNLSGVSCPSADLICHWSMIYEVDQADLDALCDVTSLTPETDSVLCRVYL